MARTPILLVLALSACKEPRAAQSGLDTTEHDAGVDYSAVWRYRSPDVDVDLTLVTLERDGGCTTTSRLAVDDALSVADFYDLAPTDCAVLRLGADGDIVMDGATTGHDWTVEDLSVNTDTEVIALGPATGIDPESGDAVSYTFSISAPPCNDGTDCDCGVLRRTGGPTAHALPLGRVCD
jgi:hypothetical protein